MSMKRPQSFSKTVLCSTEPFKNLVGLTPIWSRYHTVKISSSKAEYILRYFEDKKYEKQEIHVIFSRKLFNGHLFLLTDNYDKRSEHRCDTDEYLRFSSN